MLDFGIEIECCVPGGYGMHVAVGNGIAERLREAGVGCWYAGYTHARSTDWKIVTDSSISAPDGFVGLEFVSPPYSDEGIAKVETVCRILAECGARVNKSCGLHVHIGAHALSINAMKQLARIYHDYESVIDSLLPPSRRQSNTYCVPLRAHTDLRAINRAVSVQEIQRAVVGGTRYAKLNFGAYWKHKTVEFRQHSGTVDAVKITKWVFFCQQLVDLAKKTADTPNTEALSEVLQRRLRRAKKSAIIYQLASRSEGVTGPEMQAVLNSAQTPSPSIPLTRLGVPFERRGRRNGHTVYRVLPAEIAPITNATLPNLLQRLNVQSEEQKFWEDRAALLAGTVSAAETETH
jgi:hypothetical protein